MLIDQVSIKINELSTLQMSQQFQVKVNPVLINSTKQHIIQRHQIYITNPKCNQLSMVSIFESPNNQKQTLKLSDNKSSKIFSPSKEDNKNCNLGQLINNQQLTIRPQIRKKTIRDIITRSRLQIFTQENGLNTQKKQQQHVLDFLLNEKNNKQKLQIEVKCPINQSNLNQFNNDKLQMFEFLTNFLDQNHQVQKSVTVNIPFNQNDKNQTKKQEAVKAFVQVMQEFQGLNKIFPNLKLNFKNQPYQGNFQQRIKSSHLFPLQNKFPLNTITQEIQKMEQMIEKTYLTNKSRDYFLNNHDKAKFQYLTKKILDSNKTLPQQQNKMLAQQNSQGKLKSSQQGKINKDNKSEQEKLQILDFERFKTRKNTRKSTQVMTLGLRRGSYSEQQIRKISKRQMKPKKFVILINRVDIEEDQKDSSVNNNSTSQELTTLKRQNYQALL